jgi:hypothetical protein
MQKAFDNDRSQLKVQRKSQFAPNNKWREDQLDEEDESEEDESE